MSVVTDTTNHENGVRAIRESPLREVGRGLFSEEYLSHFVPFCSILFVIVKFIAFAGSRGTGHDGEAHEHASQGFFFVKYVPYCAVLHHFLVVASAGGGQSHMDSVVHAFLFVKSGEALRRSEGW